MAFSSSSLSGAVARLALAVLLFGAALTPVLPVAAASQHNDNGIHGGNGQAEEPRSFNVDPNPCGPAVRRAHADRADCNKGPPRGQHFQGPQRPGSSAFGLQFNSDGY